ncbi:MAG: B12-binding domain-containing radical SAM protein [Desulfomonile tiedjei]|nr:B12-binding domain-containing radical SAM protein [Desulfomonile tiedjei]
MRVLLANPGYPQTFWSFDSVLKMIGKRILFPPLGLLTVAALLPENWDVKIRDLTGQDISDEDWRSCDVVMISGMVTQYTGIVELIRESKRKGKSVVVGGPLAFHIPQDMLEFGADIVVRGEVEEGVQMLVEALERGRSGFIIETPPRPDLKHCVPPKYDLLDLDIYETMAIQFSRGCPFRCEFCDITLMFGRSVRTKAPQQVLKELDILYDLGWRKGILFVDDNFIGQPLSAKALLRQLIPWMDERGYPFEFITQASVNLAADPEMLDLMVRAGFFRVFMGIETPDRESLRQAKKFQNTSVDLDQVCETVNRAGLQVIAGCIIGFDNEEPGADQRLIEFANRNHIPEMFVTLLQAGPGTEIWKRLQAEDRLLSTSCDDSFGSQTGLMNFLPTRPMSQIVEEFINIHEVLYERESYLKRTFEHLSRMVPPPVSKGFATPSLLETLAALKVVLRLGVIHSSRWTFWKSLIRGMIKFPKRMGHFFAYCVTLEHYYAYRRTIKDQLTAKLPKIQQEARVRRSVPFQTGQEEKGVGC